MIRYSLIGYKIFFVSRLHISCHAVHLQNSKRQAQPVQTKNKSLEDDAYVQIRFLFYFFKRLQERKLRRKLKHPISYLMF